MIKKRRHWLSVYGAPVGMCRHCSRTMGPSSADTILDSGTEMEMSRFAVEYVASTTHLRRRLTRLLRCHDRIEH